MLSHILQNLNGKIERSFRTIKDNYINCTDWNTFSSLDDLNFKYNEYINEEYNTKIHSSIKSSPRDKFNSHYDNLKFAVSHDAIDEMFLYTFNRKVSSDATISLNSIHFEVPQQYIKQTIKVRYSPDDTQIAYIYDVNNKNIHTIKPVNKIDNSKIKRETISYSNLGGDINV